MKKIILVLCLFASNGYGEPIGVDKYAHFGLSHVGTEVGLKSCASLQDQKPVSPFCRVVVSSLVLTAGVGKELYDQNIKQTKFDTGDLAADVLGIITGNLLQWDF